MFTLPPLEVRAVLASWSHPDGQAAFDRNSVTDSGAGLVLPSDAGSGSKVATAYPANDTNAVPATIGAALGDAKVMFVRDGIEFVLQHVSTASGTAVRLVLVERHTKPPDSEGVSRRIPSENTDGVVAADGMRWHAAPCTAFKGKYVVVDLQRPRCVAGIQHAGSCEIGQFEYHHFRLLFINGGSIELSRMHTILLTCIVHNVRSNGTCEEQRCVEL